MGGAGWGQVEMEGKWTKGLQMGGAERVCDQVCQTEEAEDECDGAGGKTGAEDKKRAGR